MSEKSPLLDFSERYDAGQIPWDDELPPPELIDLAGNLTPGRALDLGCGYGRSSIFLAAHGWSVVGVDFVPLAVERATKRAVDAGLGNEVSFYTADVTDLSFLDDRFDLVVDVGCMHSLDHDGFLNYRAGVVRLLKIGGYYLLFAHLRDTSPGMDQEQRWIEDSMVRQLFHVGFKLVNVEFGTTQVQDNPPWSSAWYLFQRQKD